MRPEKPDIPADALAEMERLGPEGVRELLARNNEGRLFTTHGPYRNQVRQWLVWKDVEQQAHQERREARRDWWARGIALGALIVAILSWLFPHR